MTAPIREQPFGGTIEYDPVTGPSLKDIQGTRPFGGTLDRGEKSIFDPTQPGFSLQPRGGMETPKVISQGITPIGKFALILLLFALAIMFLPKGVRGWFALIIVMGALVSNPGAIGEFREWIGV